MAKHRFFFRHRRRQLRIEDEIRQMVWLPPEQADSELPSRVRSIQKRYPIDAVWGAVRLVESLPEVQRHALGDALSELFPEQSVRACFASERMEDRVISMEAIGLGRIQELEPLVHVGLEDPELAPFAAVALCRLKSQGAFHRVMALLDATRITNSQALAAIARLSDEDRKEGFSTTPNHPLATYFEPPVAARP